MTYQEMMVLLEPFASKMELVGSRITCNPPPMNTDQDILVFTHRRANYSVIKDILQKNGFTTAGAQEEYPGSGEEFLPYKNAAKDINFIITMNEEYFDKFMVATSVAKKLNLLKKEDRVMLFEAVIRGTRYIDVTVTQLPGEIDWFSINKKICGGQ